MTIVKQEKNQSTSPIKRAFRALEDMESKLEAIEYAQTEPIAIIGMGCRFPGNANTPEHFWQLLRRGQDAVVEIPPQRWDVDALYDPDPDSPGKMYIRQAAFVDQVDQFDPHFFGISPREATSLDPQQRFLLEVTWEALESAGINPQTLEDTQTGVFLGMGQNDYALLNLHQLDNIGPYDVTGNGFCFAAGRLSYALGLQGPSVAIDTACSSSLVAIHQACHSLRSGESTLAIAAGVQLILSPLVTTAQSRLKALAPDGRCKTFDAAADGYGRGEGCGVVVLKRLSDALKEGDHIWAVIRGSAVNHDGLSSGLTVPNKLAQEKLIQQALKAAKTDPAQVSYVEAHGTGTSLGDPLEVRALASVFGEKHDSGHPLLIGSVKTNIGHLEAAAGIAGLIKVILQLKYQEIAPHLNFNTPNPYIDWQKIPLKVSTQLTPWSLPLGPRVAGISSFAISGTNAHVVLAEAPAPVKRESIGDRPLHLLTLSAKTQLALEALANRYHQYLGNHPETDIADVCYTANIGRADFNYRLAAIASHPQEFAQQLLSVNMGEPAPGLCLGQANRSNFPTVAFLFTGQGSQYVNMGRQLYQTQPLFRRTLQQCNDILQSDLEVPLLDVLYPDRDGKQDPEKRETVSLLDQTVYTQPALFAIEYALAQVWQSWGVTPDVVMGHSIGEYVAATIAGVFSLEEGLKLIAARGRLMQQLSPGGSMVSVMASAETVRSLIPADAKNVSIAAINGPDSVVISGETEALRAITQQLESIGVKLKPLQVAHGFHSPLMKPMLAEFEQVARQVSYTPSRLKLISNVTGQVATAEIATPDYWCHHILSPVNFAAGMEALHQQQCDIFLECGSQPTLLGMGRQCLPAQSGTWLPSLRPGQDDWQQMLTSLGELYVKGITVNWASFDQDAPQRHKITLPTYPFQRQRYWLETKADNGQNLLGSSSPLHPLIAQKLQSPLSKDIFFESHFSIAALPFLADHLIYDHAVVPGACHLSLLLAAASLTWPQTGCQLTDIVFPQALALSDHQTRTVQTILTPQQDTQNFKVISFEDPPPDNGISETEGYALHAEGTLVPWHDRLPLLSLQDIQSRCAQIVDGTAVYQHINQKHFELGPSFRWIETAWVGDGEVLGQLKQPTVVRDTTRYQLYPALIDACFQVLIAARVAQSSPEAETWIPFQIERFCYVDCPQGETLWCHGQLRQAQTTDSDRQIWDLQLCDATGQGIARIEGLEARKANPTAVLKTLQTDLRNWFYTLEWQEEPVNPGAQVQPQGPWLIFTPLGELGESLQQQLQAQGATSIQASAGSTYQQLNPGHYQINPLEPSHFQQIVELESWQGIIHLWSLEHAEMMMLELDTLQQAQELGCASVLHLVQALEATQQFQSVPLYLVTKGAQSVQSQSRVQVHQTPLWGLGRVITQEYPQLRCQCLDLDPDAPWETNVGALIAELAARDGENQIAYRQTRRYVPRLQQSRLDPQRQPSFLPDASYWITGGLGALGLQVAQWMVNQGARYLVLSGRHAPSETAANLIEALETAGASVQVVLGDVAQKEDVETILETMATSLPPLKGIIHAAGVLDDAVLQNMDWQQFINVMAPKVLGTWHLHQLTQHLPLDFFICFSSMAALLGSPGQGNYAAANAFMDGVAHDRRAQGLPALSINWGPWAQGGMAARLGNQHSERWQDLGLQSIGFDQGMQALATVFQHPDPQVSVMPVNWSQWSAQVPAGMIQPMLAALAVSQPEQSQSGWFFKQLDAVPLEQHRQVLADHVRWQVAQVLGIKAPEQIDPQVGWFEMGVDSLMITELRNRLQSSLDCRLSATDLFNYNTIEDLVTYLDTDILQLGQDSGVDHQGTPLAETEVEPPSDLDLMDSDQVETSISQELEELEGLLRKG